MEEDQVVAQPSTEAVEIGQGLFLDLSDFLLSLLRPWNAYQALIVIGLIVVAYALKRWVGPIYYDWLHGRSGWPMSRMRGRWSSINVFY